MHIRFDHIKASSHVDGPGERVVLFVQGCTLACPGCQNRHLHPHAGGYVSPTDEIAVVMATLAAKHGNVTVSGGEPFQQAMGLAYLLREMRRQGVQHILVYTGYTWETLTTTLDGGFYLFAREALQHIDVLVDGPFVAGQDDDMLSWRGSRNQRVIDVPASLAAGHPVLLDWDAPAVIVTAAGDLLMPAGMAPEMAEIGPVGSTRRCGETGAR